MRCDREKVEQFAEAMRLAAKRLLDLSQHVLPNSRMEEHESWPPATDYLRARDYLAITLMARI